MPPGGSDERRLKSRMRRFREGVAMAEAGRGGGQVRAVASVKPPQAGGDGMKMEMEVEEVEVVEVAATASVV